MPKNSQLAFQIKAGTWLNRTPILVGAPPMDRGDREETSITLVMRSATDADLARIGPLDSFFLVRGPDGLLHGRDAWKISVRYDFVDLNNVGIDGDVFDAVTLGLNWHPEFQHEGAVELRAQDARLRDLKRT